MQPPRARWYALRHKPTGRLFPSGDGRVSYREFTDELPPRLYSRPQDALATARHWVKGHSWIPYNARQDPDAFIYMKTKPVEGRNMDDLDIIECKLSVVEYLF